MRTNVVWAGVLAAGVAFSGGFFSPTPLAHADDSKQVESSQDTVILRSGRIVSGQILEETDTEVTMLVVMGSLKARTTYAKKDILEIERGSASDAMAKDGETMAEAFDPAALNKKDVEWQGPGDSYDPGTLRLLIVELEETFGVQSSESPLEEMFEEADKLFGDVQSMRRPDGTVKRVVDPLTAEQNVVVIKMNTQTNPQQGFDGMWRAETIAPVVEHEIVEKGRRVVFWIENAGGGASFLPWVSDEIYFMRDGIMGGIGSLQDFDIGDEMVNEKQISLRLGHAEGFAIKGGYGKIGPPIIRAMARADNWLCVRFEGGEPMFLEADPKVRNEGYSDWVVLTDNGEGENEDEFSFKGNDVLNINADWASKLGLSDGTADDVDELADLLGEPFDYVYVEEDTGAHKVLERWAESIETAIDMISQNPNTPGKLWVEYRSVPNDFPDDPRRAIGVQIRTLKQIRSVLSRFEEVFDSSGAQRAQLDVMIEQHKVELQQLSRRGGRR
ncbi:MAG: hypothetical protein AAGD00_04500 [Planctomycetota bacterium]